MTRVMWGVMGHLRVFHCREATDEIEEEFTSILVRAIHYL